MQKRTVCRYILFFVSTTVYCTPVEDATACHVGNIPVQENLDLKKMSGIWYSFGNTINIYGEYSWQSVTWNFVTGDDNTTLLAFLGYSPQASECTDIFVGSLHDNIVNTGHEKYIFKIVHTDYDTAVVYVCKDLEVTGECPHQKMDVYLWSRELNVPNDKIEELNQYVSLTCENVDHIHFLDTGTCRDPYLSKSLATSSLFSEDTHSVVNVLAAPNTRVALPCDVEEDHGNVVWFHNEMIMTYSDRKITDDPRVSIGRTQIGQWNLIIDPITVDDQGIYSCVHDHDHVRKIAVTLVGCDFLIFESPEILESHTTGDVQVAEGEDARFFCNATGSPTPTINWYFTSDPEYGDSEKQKLEQTGSELVLHAVDKSMSGKYTCMADNGYPPAVELDMFLGVDFAPVVQISNTRQSQKLSQDVVIECSIRAEPFPEVWWSHDGERIPTYGERRSIEVFQEGVATIVLTLSVKNLQTSDFGIYTCAAMNEVGQKETHMLLSELEPLSDGCTTNNIRVQPEFDLNKFAGTWHRIKTTTHLYGDKTFLSENLEVIVEDSTIKNEFLMAYRGYSTVTDKCLDAGIIKKVEAEPGSYTLSNGDYVYKVVYTDYEYAVIYYCENSNLDSRCPLARLHVDILSKHETIPEDVLEKLELYVSSMCVDVSQMMTTIPGLCPISSEFLASHSYIQPVDNEKCKLKNMKIQQNFDAGKFAGNLYAVASTPSPSGRKLTLRLFEMIHDVTGRLNLLMTPYSFENEVCLPTGVSVFNWDEEHQWFKHNHHKQTVYTKVIFTDYTNSVLYSCVEINENGACAPGKHRFQIISRDNAITESEIRRLKRYAVDLCVDVNEIEVLKQVGEICTAREQIVEATKRGEMTDADARQTVGCNIKYLPIQTGLTVELISGAHYTVFSSSGMPPDNQHGPTYLVATNTGGLVMLLTQYNMNIKSCNPTGAMKFSEESVPGNFSYDIPGGPHVISMIVHTDEENHNAVIYKCMKVDSDGYCNPLFQSAKILSKDKEISMKKFMELKKASASKCINVDKLMPVRPGPVACTVPDSMLEKAKSDALHPGFSVIGCMTDFIPVHPNLDPTKMVGAWNTILTTNNIQRLKQSTSEVGHLIISDDLEAFYIHRSFRRSWRACEPAEVIRLIPTGTPGDYKIHREKEHGFVKVVYTDYTNAVTYTCYSVQADGTCEPDRLHVRIVSRRMSLSMEKIQKLQQSVTSACAKFNDMIFTAPGQCKIPKTIIAGVQKGEITDDFSIPLIGCNDHIVPVQKNLDTSRLLGSWNHLYRPSKFMRQTTAKSKISHLLPVKGGLLRLWRGYNDTTDLCRPTEAGTKIEAAGPGDYYYAADHFPVIFKIIYTDYVNAVTLSCLGMNQDGKCMKGRLLVEIISKNTDIDDETLESLLPHISQACGDIKDMGKKSTGLCSIPPSLIDSAKSGDVKEDYTVVQCKSHLIPVQDNFDIDRFVGKWNVMKKTVYISGDESSTSQQRLLVKTNQDRLLSLEKEYKPAPVDGCEPTKIVSLKPGSRSGHYIIDYENVTAIFKIIYTDYTEAVTYFCLGVGPDGSCIHDKLQIEIWSKHDTISDEKFQILRHFVADSCAEVGDLIDVTPDRCTIPSNLIQAAKADEIDTTNINAECQVRFMPVQKNFNFDNFTGIWHSLVSTQYLFGINTWTSSIVNYVAHEDGSLNIAFRGFAPYLNKCTRTASLELTNEGVDGYYSMRSKAGTKVHLKVIATDYDTALVYTCVHINEDGFCAKNKYNLEIASRDPDVDVALEIQKYKNIISNLCIPLADLAKRDIGVCDNPYLLGTKCLLSDIKLEENFITVQLTGFWYELARTRFTFNKMESGVYYYQYDKERHLLQSTFTGTMDGICQTAMQSLAKSHEDGPDANMLGKLGDEDSIYPWVTFRTVYFDGFNVMYYACYNVQPDGTCRADQIEVGVLGRTKEMGEKLKAQLPTLMTSLCLNVSELVTVKREADCVNYITGFGHSTLMSKQAAEDYPDVSSCKLKDIQTPKPIDPNQLLGVWYGISSVDYGTNHNTKTTNGFVMRIAKLTSASYRIQHQQDENGSCQVISDVFAKPLCETDISGDFLSTSGSSMMTQWTMLKILHFTENELILYWCTRENEGGSCEIEGVRVDLLSRSPTYKPSSSINIEEKLNMVCLESKNLIDVESSLSSACHPETLPPPPSPPPIIPISSCAVDVLPKTNVDIERIAGYWYEVASPPPEPLFPLRNMVLYYHPVGTQHIKMIISGEGPDGKCKGPLYGDFKVRCTEKPDGRFLGRLNKTGLWTWTTMQIMYTDYDHVAIAYSCMNEREDGSCNPASAKAHILSRQTTLDETRRKRMNGIILSACLSPLNDHIHDGVCKSKVAEGLEMLEQKVNAAPA